jgi:reticulon-1
VTTVAVAHINAIIGEFRRLFLVEDLIDSIKFGAFLWFLTYVGAMFNGMTLIILGNYFFCIAFVMNSLIFVCFYSIPAFVALFTLPKVYENNKQSIDSHLDVVRNKVSEITEK